MGPCSLYLEIGNMAQKYLLYPYMTPQYLEEKTVTKVTTKHTESTILHNNFSKIPVSFPFNGLQVQQPKSVSSMYHVGMCLDMKKVIR